MPLVAVTRLRIRSWRFVVPFAWRAWRSTRQARRATGNLGAKVRRANGLVFWTATVWRDEAAMIAYRGATPHGDAMPKLLDWCDEAALVHWQQDDVALPEWRVAEQRMAESGRLSRVKHPSPSQRAGRLDYRPN